MKRLIGVLIFGIGLATLCYGKERSLSPDSSQSRASVSSAGPAYDGTSAARAEFEAGKLAAKKEGGLKEAVAHYQKAISLDPNFVEAQVQYSQSQPPKTVAREYERLAALHPHMAVYPYVLAQQYVELDLPRAERYCRKAVQIDPRFPQGYACLALIANLHEETAKAIAFQRKAVQLDPKNTELAEDYLLMLKDEPAAFQAEAKKLIQRFPHSSALFYPLYLKASQLEPDSARIGALKKLRSELPAGASDVSGSIDSDLFQYYLSSDLHKALAIARTAVQAKIDDYWPWKDRLAYVHGLLKAQGEIGARQPDAALSTLKSIQGQRDKAFAKTWYLLQARALVAADKTAEAVTLLRGSFLAQPTDVVLNALVSDGAKLGKTKSEIDHEIWTALKAKARPAPGFTLKRFVDGKPISLSDYRGKVVIVDFWFPECGPCREEFPYLQKVAAKFKERGVTVLAINSVKEQENLVMPFLQSHGYDFLPLEGNLKDPASAYHVSSFPHTFVIGADGNIYFRPNIYDDARVRSTELAIQFLLAHAES